MTRAEPRAGLDLLPAWALEQKAAADRQVIAVTRQRLAAGDPVCRYLIVTDQEQLHSLPL